MAYNSYVYGTEARKLNTINVPKQKRKVVKKNTVSKVKPKTVFVVSCLFIMLMIVTYRYNLINESNFKVQNLKKELEVVSSNLAATQINVEQATNLTNIENYAKQKLGMQKPDKNQILYIDSSKNASVVKSEDKEFFAVVLEKLKEIFK
jgi:cell division protein FtsL